MKQLLMPILIFSMIFLSACYSINTENAKLEKIGLNYLVTLENGDQYYGVSEKYQDEKWFTYPESEFIDDDKLIKKLNEFIRSKKFEKEINTEKKINEKVFKSSGDYPRVTFNETGDANKGHIIEFSKDEIYYRIWDTGPAYDYITGEQVDKVKEAMLEKFIVDRNNKNKNKNRSDFVKNLHKDTKANTIKENSNVIKK